MARYLCFCLGVAALLFVPLRPAAAEPQAVVELFTSQGCSSCKAADAYLEELVGRPDVLALSFHVDYWDYLGWPDTLAQPENTARQRDYAESLGTRRIYTPQIVVNGMVDAVGSDRQAVETAIAKAALRVPVSLSREHGTLVIVVGARPLPGSRPTTIRLVLFASKAEVQITRGENAGSTIVYRNVVRAIRPIGMWDGATVKITLPENELMGDGIDGCAVIVQEDVGAGPGAILGAAQLKRW
jgi:hypothetical protein